MWPAVDTSFPVGYHASAKPVHVEDLSECVDVEQSFKAKSRVEIHWRTRWGDGAGDASFVQCLRNTFIPDNMYPG
jgi:hypothetical protein